MAGDTLWTRLQRSQDRLSDLLGSPPAQRVRIVRDMMQRDPRDSIAYWLQLVVALGIATLGLVLDSSAVVIGAMLIAPLMSPIVSLGMGLSVGSPFLVVRASARIVASIAAVIGASAALTRALPFRELTTEIAARTNPTLLDLVTAGFCAVAGAYAALRPGSATVTAAGTSIGISLVPPLCVSGFGIGIGSAAVAKGAALLFVANLAAIVVVCTVAFSLAGFAHAPVAEIEVEELAHQRPSASRTAARLLARVFTAPGGYMRVLLPFVLLIAVYVPLRRALDEVVWQVQARAEVQRAMATLSLPLVQSRLRVERRTVDLSLILLGSADDVARVEAQLRQAIRERAGVDPVLRVDAVPNVRALERAAQATTAARIVGETVTTESADALRERLDQRVSSALQTYWPTRSRGRPLATWLRLDERAEALSLVIVHAGPGLDAAGREVLRRGLETSLAMTVDVRTHDVPTDVLVADGDPAWAQRLASRWAQMRWMPGARVCVGVPTAEDAAPASTAALRDLSSLLADDVPEQQRDTVLRGTVALSACETVLAP